MLKKTILCIFTAKLVCATVLSGSVDHLTLTPDKNPYIIEDNLTIKESGLLTIEKGCTLLFKPFTGIVVDGSLIVEGTLEEPVVFTTINDNKFNKESTVFANPFDWNGILINEKANKVRLCNFVLTYSVYGIRSMKEELTINNGSFKNNGQFHMTVKDVIKPIADGIPYSYKDGKTPAQNTADDSKSKLPIALAISGLVCGGGSAVSAIVFSHSRKVFPDISETGKLHHTENVIKGTLVSTIACGTAAIILLPAALIVHKKNNTEDQQKNVQLVPIYYKEGMGIVAQVLF